MFKADNVLHVVCVGLYSGRAGRKETNVNAAAAAKSLQSCLTLCSPSSPPGPPVPGILQARTLAWVNINGMAN